jgi:Tol biopolymer transport system component
MMSRWLLRPLVGLTSLLLLTALLAVGAGGLRPNGRLLSYTHADTQQGGSSLRLLDIDHMRQHPFSLPDSDLGTDAAHFWSPAGTRLAYTMGSGAALHLLDIASGDSAQIGAAGCCHMAFAWSPDGSRLAYLHQSPADSQTDLVIVEVATGQAQTLWTDSLRGIPSLAWSPDGRWLSLAVEGRRNHLLALIDADSGQMQTLPTHVLSAPVWSPDSRQLVVVTDASGSPDIYLLDIETHALTPFIATLGDDFAPVWSPDGTRLAHISTDEGYASIYVVTLADGARRRLARFAYYDHRQTVWHEDGRWLVFGSIIDGTGEIFIGDALTGEVRRLTRDGDNIYPAWQP